MKQTLIISILIVFTFISSYGQDTIPNNSFENWVTMYNPKNWETTNMLLPLGVNNCSRSTNSHTGMYALKLETINMEGLLVPGVATLGTIGFNNTTGGIPFDSKPIALRGYYVHPTNGDEVLIGIEFYKNGEEIGDGVWTSTDSVADYTEFVIPITFYTNQNPDTLNITILTDQYDTISSLLIDGLEMKYQATGVSPFEGENKFVCYPNPGSGLITFEFENESQAQIEIYSLDGRLVKSIETHTISTLVDLSFCRPGMYSVIVRQGSKVLSRKLVIQ